MAFRFGWPQGIYLALLFYRLVDCIAHDGESDGTKHGLAALIGTVLVIALLVWGGFFG